MTNVKEFAARCLWFTASALAGCVGLAFGASIAFPYLFIGLPVSFCSAYLESKKGAEEHLRFLTNRGLYFMMPWKIREAYNELKEGAAVSVFCHAFLAPSSTCVTIVHDIIILPFMLIRDALGLTQAPENSR